MSNSRLNERLFMDTVHADVVFVVENEKIPGHRGAFATSCAYFDKLLNGDFKESKSVEVEITGTSAKVFKEVKRYIYLGLLDTDDWKIDDLLGLLSVGHEYQYQELFAEVMNVFEKQPLDFISWPLVNSAAALYDSASLKAKCVGFAEAKVDNFLRLENTEILTDEFICAMFETPKIRTVNQDQLLSSLLQWKKTHSSAQIMSVFEKICWNEVSPQKTAIIAKLFFHNPKMEDESPVFNQMIDEIQAQSQWIVKLDNVALLRGKQVGFALENSDCNIYLLYYEKGIQFNFGKSISKKQEIPVKRIEIELTKLYHIEDVDGRTISCLHKAMKHKIVAANNDWLKYSATFSEAEPVYLIDMYFDSNLGRSEIKLRSLVIY